jgi:hypothetical protein
MNILLQVSGGHAAPENITYSEIEFGVFGSLAS